MINVTVSEYKDLIKCLDKSISELSLGLCRSETYGYCANKEKLTKHIQLKKLMVNSFNLDKLKEIYNTVCHFKNWDEYKYFNKIVEDSVEILIKKVYKIVRTDKEFRFKLPNLPFKGGYYIENVFICNDLETREDYNSAICILNNLQYKGFVNFEIDETTNEIFSKTSYDYLEEFSYEYKEIDAMSLIQCVDVKTIKKLIEKTIN
jgi:hypothetical protein